MKEEKKEELKDVNPTENKISKKGENPKMRQIIIETDGNVINLTKAEVSGKIELVGILQNLIAFINQQK